MPIITVDYFQAVCDGCGVNVTAGGEEITAWAEREGAEEEVRAELGTVEGDVVKCGRCVLQSEPTIEEIEAREAAEAETAWRAIDAAQRQEQEPGA